MAASWCFSMVQIWRCWSGKLGATERDRGTQSKRWSKLALAKGYPGKAVCVGVCVSGWKIEMAKDRLWHLAVVDRMHYRCCVYSNRASAQEDCQGVGNVSETRNKLTEEQRPSKLKFFPWLWCIEYFSSCHLLAIRLDAVLQTRVWRSSIQLTSINSTLIGMSQ